MTQAKDSRRIVVLIGMLAVVAAVIFGAKLLVSQQEPEEPPKLDVPPEHAVSVPERGREPGRTTTDSEGGASSDPAKIGTFVMDTGETVKVDLASAQWRTPTLRPMPAAADQNPTPIEEPIPVAESIQTLHDLDPTDAEKRLLAVQQMTAGLAEISDDELEAVRAELAGLLEDPDPSVKTEALEGLVELGDDRVAGVVQDWLTNPDASYEPLRHAGIRNAYRLGMTDQLPLIREYLSHGDPFTRMTALTAVGAMGDEASRELVEAATRDENRRVVRYAKRALAMMDARRAEGEGGFDDR